MTWFRCWIHQMTAIACWESRLWWWQCRSERRGSSWGNAKMPWLFLVVCPCGVWYRWSSRLLRFLGRIFTTVRCPWYIKQSEKWLIIISRKEQSGASINWTQQVRWLAAYTRGLVDFLTPFADEPAGDFHVQSINQLNVNIQGLVLKRRNRMAKQRETNHAGFSFV